MKIWDNDVSKIRETLLMMSGLAERNLANALRAYAENDSRRAQLVEAEDAQIDQLELLVDDLVVKCLSTHGSVPSDCRMMLSASKISRELERIADESTTIARRSLKLHELPPLARTPEIHDMGCLVQEMLRDTLSAFVHADTELALEVIARDKTVDALHKELVYELSAAMQNEPVLIARLLHVITIAKCIERIGDHATNIAEEVVLLCEGRDIRHTKDDSTSESKAA
jgi:phosphate transport system protein